MRVIGSQDMCSRFGFSSDTRPPWSVSSNLTPRPPSLRGKGEEDRRNALLLPLSASGRGQGEGLHQQDSAGLVTFDNQVRDFLRPSSQPSHLKQMVAVLNRGPV